VTIPNCQAEGITSDGDFLVVVPPAFRDGVRLIVAKCREKHGGFVKVSVDVPSKPRTFGPGSQSAHLHGHLQQLAVHFGYTLGEMKEAMKYDVPEWPREERKFGNRRLMRPVSEATVSTVVESRAIEWCHMVAGDEGLVLIEGKEKK
jgi:hypothetical protein